MNKGIKLLKNKYVWMLLMGFLLTALLVLTIWITSEPWKTIFNISAMLGSGVFCSALVSWIIEVNNNKAIAKEHERQRKFILRSMQLNFELLVREELKNLSEYCILKETCEKKLVIQKEWTIVDAISKIKEYLEKLVNDYNVRYQWPAIIDSAYIERVNDKKALAFESALTYYKIIESSLSELMNDSNMYYLSGILNEDKIDNIRIMEISARDVIRSSNSANFEQTFTFKQLFFADLDKYLEMFDIDVTKKGMYYYQEIKN